MLDHKYTHFPNTGKHKKSIEHDSAKSDSSMMSLASGIANERGENDSLSKEYVYRRMEQKQRIMINKFGSSKKAQEKLHNFYTHQMGGTYNQQQLAHMYGIYQDGGEEKMFETIRPMSLQKGDLVYNNLIGEIGILQDNCDRGDKCLLVFSGKSFVVNKADHGWSKKKIMQDESDPVAASSAQGPAMFKEQVDSSQSGFVNDSMKKIKQEVEKQDNPNLPKIEHIVDVEMEHTDNVDEAKKIAKDHIKENKDYYKYYDPFSSGKEYLVKMDDSEEDYSDIGTDADDDYDDDDDGWSDDEEFADAGTPHISPYASPKRAKYESSFPKEQFHALAKEHNIPPGSRMSVTSYDKNRLQDVTHYGTYKGPGKDIGIPNIDKFHPKQIHGHYSNSNAKTIKLKEGGTLTHFKPEGRYKPEAVHDIPDVSHHEYFKGVMEQHKKNIEESKNMSPENIDAHQQHIKAISKHLESYKGEKGTHGPSENMARHLQHENSTMYLLGKSHREDMTASYSDLPSAHSKFTEKYGRNPEAIVHTMPRGKEHEIGRVSSTEREQHMKQLTSVNKPGAGFGAAGMNRQFRSWQPETRASDTPVGTKNKYGEHQRVQNIAVGKAKSHSDMGKAYHGIFEHKAFPTNLGGGAAEGFVKQRDFTSGMKKFNLSSPTKQFAQKQRESAAQRIRGSSENVQKNTPQTTSGPSGIEKIQMKESSKPMGLSPAELSK